MIGIFLNLAVAIYLFIKIKWLTLEVVYESKTFYPYDDTPANNH